MQGGTFHSSGGGLLDWWGSKLPLTGGQKEPCKEQSQAFVAIRLVGSQRTHLFKVTFLSCFLQRNISGKMCLKSLLFFEEKI